MKKNSKTALMAAAFAAAMSFSACHSFDDYTNVYGPPPDTGETQPVQTSEQVTETVIPQTEPQTDPAETTTSGVTSTDTGTSDVTTTGTDTLTETSAPEGTDSVTTAAYGVPEGIELPTLFDPDKQDVILLYGPPGYES